MVDWFNQILSLVGMVGTLLGMFLAGKRRLSGWVVALASEAAWIWWSLRTVSWGVLGLSVALSGVYAWNIYKWNGREFK